ncbi:uncharacterized oxidoreductase YrbE isoform X1 [Patella vulgata]|uniref:uncharacterized oxidoreductase YrbE isoform X1 n=2 Tax=Patella vulgata TaxID=6465 RepID=UPI00217F25FA|nr:uncharacterized oxidoreductase YrbE isoform X1 [Patella vulgata]XP_055956928.1 uncharacterized oxidoreductase YrbE isoform X1 [Patella vulgata]
MASVFGVAIIGMGNMGLVHFKNCIMSPRANVRWVVRQNVENAKRLVKSYNLPVKCTSPDNIDHVLDDDSVNAVIICSPTDTHKNLITKSLEAGKHVFAEKPITPNLESTEKCYDLAEQKNKSLLCAFHRRFDPSFSQLYDNLQNKALGNLRLLKISSHDMAPPPIEYVKISGGILSDSTIHDIDMSSWLAGSKPTSIYVQSSAFDKDIAKYDCDLVVVTIMFNNGVISVIDNGRQVSYGYHQQLEALCDKGVLNVTNRRVHQLEVSSAEQSVIPSIDQHYSTRYTDAYMLELDHFMDVIQGKCEMKVTKDQVLQVQALIEAGRKSQSLKTPVLL